MASDKNPRYSEFWANWDEMGQAQQIHDGNQILGFLKGASLSGVVEILENAPIYFKRYAWEQWAKEADLSGYLLNDIIALQDTETPTISYMIVKSWLSQADLSRATEQQVTKMSLILTTRADRAELWTRWYRHTDLTAYDFMDFAKLLCKVYPSVAVGMNEAWMMACGPWAIAQIKNLSYSERQKLQKFPLPARVYDSWYKVRHP